MESDGRAAREVAPESGTVLYCRARPRLHSVLKGMYAVAIVYGGERSETGSNVVQFCNEVLENVYGWRLELVPSAIASKRLDDQLAVPVDIEVRVCEFCIAERDESSHDPVKDLFRVSGALFVGLERL